MNKQLIRISKKQVLLLLLIIPFIRQRSIQEWPHWLISIQNYWSLVSATIIYIYIFRKSQKGVIKKAVPFIIFWIVYVVITLLRYPSLDQIVKVGQNAYFCLSIALLVTYELNSKPKYILGVMAFAYTLYTLINNILVVIFPNGFYEVRTSDFHKGHLLGDDNAIIYVALPAMIILTMYSLYKNKKISKFAIFNIILTEIVFIRLWSVSAMLCMFAYIILLYVSMKIHKLEPIVCLISVIVLISFIFLGRSLPFVSNFVENILHKNMTFSNRTYWWAHGLMLIKNRPLLGYGGYYSVGLSSLGKYTYPVHTTYLQLLIDGGFTLFGLFVWIIVSAFRCLQNQKSIMMSQVLTAGLLSIFLNYVSEWSQLYHLMFLLPLALNIDLIIEEGKERKHDFA